MILVRIFVSLLDGANTAAVVLLPSISGLASAPYAPLLATLLRVTTGGFLYTMIARVALREMVSRCTKEWVANVVNAFRRPKPCVEALFYGLLNAGYEA